MGILGIKDSVQSALQALFLIGVGGWLLFANNLALSLLPFATWGLFVFFIIDILVLVVSCFLAISNLVEGEDGAIAGLIGAIIDVALLIIAVIVFFAMQSSTEGIVAAFGFDAASFLPTAFLITAIMLARSWVAEIVSLPLSIVEFFIDGDFED